MVPAVPRPKSPPPPAAAAPAEPAPAPAPAAAAAPCPTTGAPPGVFEAQASITPPAMPSVCCVVLPDVSVPAVPRFAVRMAQPEVSATLTLPA